MAELESVSERLQCGDAAEEALATWATCVALAEGLGTEHGDEARATKDALGDAPPRAAARAIVQRPQWRVTWPEFDVGVAQRALSEP
jgi:hypothetical protein